MRFTACFWRDLCLVAVLPLFAAGCGVLERAPVIGNTSRFLPAAGDVPELTLSRPPSTYRNPAELQGALGGQAALYVAYGAEVVAAGEYTWGGPTRRLTVEATKMSNPVAASGLFHRHRGRLGAAAAPVAVGAEGVIDASRDNRNLYFYKNGVFAKLVYTGDAPVPDLALPARRMAERIGGDDYRPAGYEYLSVEGVDMDSVGVTPGYTLNFDFLPPSVCALAPGAGTPASAAYVIIANNRKNAETMENDFRDYLRLRCENLGEAKTGDERRIVRWGEDRSNSMIVTRKDRALVIIANPLALPPGRELLERIVAKIP